LGSAPILRSWVAESRRIRRRKRRIISGFSYDTPERGSGDQDDQEEK